MLDETEMRYTLRNRYQFTGSLVMQTALHIGGGRFTLSHSDSPIVVTPAGIPFIPGSSFKGSLRSTVEKLVPGLPGLTSCALIDLPEVLIKDGIPQEKLTNWPEGICPTVWQKGLVDLKRAYPRREKEITEKALRNLCHTCRLFGSPFAAARLAISDLYMPGHDWPGGIQVRDGVAIDRDSEKAKDRLKYDFEVVPASAEFTLSIVLENATPQDLQLISIGLSEFVHGFGIVGGKRSRGLGACELRDLTVSYLDLAGVNANERARRLGRYLIDGTFSTMNEPGKDFLAQQLNTLFRPSRAE